MSITSTNSLIPSAIEGLRSSTTLSSAFRFSRRVRWRCRGGGCRAMRSETRHRYRSGRRGAQREPPQHLIHEADQNRSCSARAHGIAQAALRPFLPAVEDCNDFEAVASQSVGNRIRCARHDQFPRPGGSTRTAQIRSLSETLDRIQQGRSHSIGRLRIVLRDVCAKMREVLDCPWRPDDVHTRGAFRYCLPPHERSQFSTSLCGTLRPPSSSERPF